MYLPIQEKLEMPNLTLKSWFAHSKQDSNISNNLMNNKYITVLNVKYNDSLFLHLVEAVIHNQQYSTLD